MKFSLVATLAAINLDEAQAGCDRNLKTMSNFDVKQYQGRWFDVSSTWSRGGPCTTADYKIKDNGNLGILNRMWIWWYFMSYFEIGGEGAYNVDDPSKLWVSIGSKKPVKEGVSNYNVMWTDYKNVSLVYGCKDKWWGRTEETAWVLTRDWNLSDETINRYENQIESMLPGFDETFTKHT